MRSRPRIWSHETGSAVSSRPAHSPHTFNLNLNLILTPAFRDGVLLYRQPSPGQSLLQYYRLNLILTPAFRDGVLLYRQPSPGQSLLQYYSLNLILTPAFRDGVLLYRQPSPGQSVPIRVLQYYSIRVYQVTQLRSDGVHCRESAGTGPVVLKVS